MEIAVHGARTKGHDKYGPTTVIATQSLVYIDGKAVVVEGDPIVPHPHDGNVIASQSRVYINGVRVAMVGDKISCGDEIIDGNSRVNIT